MFYTVNVVQICDESWEDDVFVELSEKVKGTT